ncbi:MAG: hypothetical protein JWQ81_7343 [Amycolatopsis sp.]|jgi:hypothetical protein|uniref:hypothetical protein n=1 Tax=Amycolatopsis sp. TaxID=37632 RepID=UPI00262990C9|nr:hypothetical protein [Amycolatopsis sp.]MCU1686604.1 hypothetical protein [Amycolatopsis sp.]
MSTGLAALLAIATIAAVYYFCVRPHRRGKCATASNLAQNADVDRQVAELREELRVLRAQDALDSGRVPSGEPAPPTDA